MTSGNFYYIKSLKENYIPIQDIDNQWLSSTPKPNSPWLGIINTLYTLTEFFEFVKRLIPYNYFEDEFYIDINLYKAENMILIVDEYDRVDFGESHISYSSKPWSNKNKTYKINYFIDNFVKLILDEYCNLVYLFQWKNPPYDNLKDTIEKFLKGLV